MSIDERFFGTWKTDLIFNHNKAYSDKEYKTFGGYLKITKDTSNVEELILGKSRKSDYQNWVGYDYHESEKKWDPNYGQSGDDEFHEWCRNADWKLLAYDSLKKTYAEIFDKNILISSTMLNFKMQFRDVHRNRFNGQINVDVSYYSGKYELIDDNTIKCTMTYSELPIDGFESEPYTIFFKRKKFLGIF
tara:strand:- start:61 stop:630 length:570 start_codon:yes stop_codon:yes gene_type:complete